MGKFTLLTREQVFDENKKLDVIKKKGVMPETTDFTKMLGGREIYLTKSDTYEYGESSEKERRIYGVNSKGEEYPYFSDREDISVRLAIKFNKPDEIPVNNGSKVITDKDGIYEVEYGYAPQTAPLSKLQKELNEELKKGTLRKTGNYFTADTRGIRTHVKKFSPQKFSEYEYKGKRYIKVQFDGLADEEYQGQNFRVERLSNGKYYQLGLNSVWIEVEPIVWLIDKNENLMISKKLIIAGTPFNDEYGKESNREFEESNLNKYLEEYFEEDINQTIYDLNGEISEYDNGDYVIGKNNIDFNFEDATPEEIITGCIKSDIPVFLHGKPGEGKSDRIKQNDPDPTIIYLANERDESLNGASVYNSEKDIVVDKKPEWLVKIEKKCEEEPEKIHILFFDEMSNADERMQKMSYNIILNREVNGRWKLPTQVRIAAAGNEREDSAGASELLEPLFDRFAHVNIVTTQKSWLKWADTPENKYEKIDYTGIKKDKKIHPEVYAYIAYQASQQREVLRTEFTGKEPNADPRKWEMASNLLYGTKQPNMLKALIGEELAADFREFCKQKVISIDDVINKNYTSKDLRMSLARKYATASYLSTVDDENLEMVRDFVKQLGEEILEVFDSLRPREVKNVKEQEENER